MFWILGDVLIHQNFKVRFSEFAIFGVVLPFLTVLGFVLFAHAIHDKKYADIALKIMGIAKPQETSQECISTLYLGNITAVPGEWIYSGLKDKKKRDMFTISPLLFGIIGYFLLNSISSVSISDPVGRVIVLVNTCITPIVYFVL